MRFMVIIRTRLLPITISLHYHDAALTLLTIHLSRVGITRPLSLSPFSFTELSLLLTVIIFFILFFTLFIFYYSTISLFFPPLFFTISYATTSLMEYLFTSYYLLPIIDAISFGAILPATIPRPSIFTPIITDSWCHYYLSRQYRHQQFSLTVNDDCYITFHIAVTDFILPITCR